MKKILRIFLFIGVVLSSATMAAEYEETNIDGKIYECSAYSYASGISYYNLTVEFSGDTVTIYFLNGGYVRLGLENSQITDPSNISASDYNQGDLWELEVDFN